MIVDDIVDSLRRGDLIAVGGEAVAQGLVADFAGGRERQLVKRLDAFGVLVLGDPHVGERSRDVADGRRRAASGNDERANALSVPRVRKANDRGVTYVGKP